MLLLGSESSTTTVTFATVRVGLCGLTQTLTILSVRQHNVPTDGERHTVTFSTRSLLRAGSFLAGVISVGWGLYVLQAVQLAGSSAQTSYNPYTNYISVYSSMVEAMIVGVFALILALLSR